MIKSLFFLLAQIILLVALINHYAHAQPIDITKGRHLQNPHTPVLQNLLP